MFEFTTHSGLWVYILLRAEKGRKRTIFTFIEHFHTIKNKIQVSLSLSYVPVLALRRMDGEL